MINLGLWTFKKSKEEIGTLYNQSRTSFLDATQANFMNAWNLNPFSSTLRAYDQIKAYKSSNVYLNKDELNKQYASLGLNFTEDTREGVVDYIVERKNLENSRASILARGPNSKMAKGFFFLESLGTSFLDPINIGASFVPVVGQAKFASMVARSGKNIARMKKGAVEGLVGNIAVEPIVYGVAKSLQSDYDLYDSFLNVTFGTVLGSGLHVGAGKLKDANTRRRFNAKVAEGKRILGDDTATDIDINLYREYYPENSQIMKDLEITDPQTRKLLLQKATGDVLLDQAVDVTPIANADPILRSSENALPNPDITMTPRQSVDDLELNNLKRNIVNRDEAQSNTELESLETQLNTIKESQKDLNLTFEQGDSEVKLTTDDLTEIQTKSKDLDEIIKDAINCVDGR